MMARIPHYHLSNGKLEKFEAYKHQPCRISWCAYNQGGGCIKRYPAGRMPAHAGTARCPGYQHIPRSPIRGERSKTKKIRVHKGKQAKLEMGQS